VSSEKFSSKTLRIFRQVARAVSGESLEPGEGNLVLFGRTSGLKTGNRGLQISLPLHAKNAQLVTS
jgi:hypothetical protein